MAYVFPLAYEVFAAQLHIEDAVFTLSRNDQTSGLGSGQPLNVELASPLWRVDVTTGPILNDDAEAVAAIVELLERPGNDFFIGNPRKIGPRQDAGGSLLGASTPTIHTIATNNRQIRIGGLPAGYVLSQGDMFAFDYGPEGQKRRALHRIAETVIASSTGISPLMEVGPHIRAGAAPGDPIFLTKPTMRAKLIPGSPKPLSVGPLHFRFQFSASQKLI